MKHMAILGYKKTTRNQKNMKVRRYWVMKKYKQEKKMHFVGTNVGSAVLKGFARGTTQAFAPRAPGVRRRPPGK